MKKWRNEVCARDLLDGEYFWPDIELQHILNAVTKCDDGWWAASARAMQFQLHDAFLETLRKDARNSYEEDIQLLGLQ